MDQPQTTPKEDSFACPICGEVVPAKAKACPNCGSCDKTGWSEAARGPDGLDLPEDPLERAKIERKVRFWKLYAKTFMTVFWTLFAIVILIMAWSWLASLHS